MAAPVEEYPIRPNVPRIRRVALQESREIVRGVYEGGLQVWEGGDDLYDYCTRHAELFAGARVLEVGCGQGLPAVFLKTRGARVDVADFVRPTAADP